MFTTLLIIAGVIVGIAAIVLFYTLKNAPDGHEDAGGFQIDQKVKPGSKESKQSSLDKKRRGSPADKSNLDAA